MKPNIVMIISDALRPKDLSLYGYNKETDPNIKKIASESIVFEKNFSASNASNPSLTSIFSGQYPTTHGFIHQHPFTKKEEIDKLRKNKFWLPIYLKKSGYATISATPLYLWFKKGFDYYMDRESKEVRGNKFLNIPIIKRILLALPGWAYSFGKKLIKVRASPHFYPSNEVIDLAISKIKETKKPFFLFMHFVDTHYPYPAIKKKKINGNTSIKKILGEIDYPLQKEYIKKRFCDTSASCLEEIKKKRDESIIYADEQIGRLYSFLKKIKLWDNTIFIILSDHGDNFGEHKIYFCRGGLYDPSVHVPLIMHLPNIKAKKIDALTQSIDIAPTILEILGEKKIKRDGKSLIRLIKTGKKIRDYVLLNDGFCENRGAIRTETRKLIISDESKCYLCGAVHGKGKEEYDLEKDPDEEKNIYFEKSELERFLPKNYL